MPGILYRELPQAVEQLLLPRPDVTDDIRFQRLCRAEFVPLYDTKLAAEVHRLGTRLALIRPYDRGASWPLARATLSDGYTRMCHRADLETLQTLEVALRGPEGAVGLEDNILLLETIGSRISAEELAALETVTRLGDIERVRAFLGAIGGWR